MSLDVITRDFRDLDIRQSFETVCLLRRARWQPVTDSGRCIRSESLLLHPVGAFF